MNSTQDKNTKKILIIFISLVIVFITLSALLAIHISYQNKELKEKDIKYKEISQKMSLTDGALNKQIKRSDSMNLILSRIRDYMPFASTLQYRDSICGKLPHKSGDIVLVKPDSSKWVIVGFSIKGGKWNHSVNYIIKDNTGKQIEVEPETIF